MIVQSMKFFKLTANQVKNVLTRNYCAFVKVKDMTEVPLHIPVMKQEVIEYLNVKDGNTVLDMTFGAGGHSKGLIEKYPNIKIIALDRDPLANGYAKELQEKLPNQITPLLGKFSELNELAKENGVDFDSVDAVLFDLGASSMQMDTVERGFGLSKSGPLDMRMDGDRFPDSITAADILNHASEDDLYKIFKVYGGERYSRLLARSITQARISYKEFKFTNDLTDLVELVVSGRRFDKIHRRTHNATKIFQALRIFVNNELNEFNYGLILVNKYLRLGGRIVVLSFHSLEDTLAKRHFQGHIFDNGRSPDRPIFGHSMVSVDAEVSTYVKSTWRPVNKKVVLPTKEEVQLNPRSRSAKLRAAEKVGPVLFSSVSF